MALTPPLFISPKPDPTTDPTLFQPSHWNRAVNLLNGIFDGADTQGSILARNTSDTVDGGSWVPSAAGVLVCSAAGSLPIFRPLTSADLPSVDSPSVLDLPEQTTVTTPAVNIARFYAVDDGGYPSPGIIDNAGHVARLNRDTIYIVKVDEPAGVTLGQLVYLSGASGSNSLVRLACANSATTLPALGWVLDPGARNAFVRVMSSGTVSGINTSAFTEGDRVFLSDVTPGAITNIAPTSPPSCIQRVGLVTRSHATQGTVAALVAQVVDKTVLTTAISGVLTPTQGGTGVTTGLSVLDAGSLSSGIVPDARLSANVQMKPMAVTDLVAHHATHETGGSDAIAALSAAVLTSGTLANARLNADVALTSSLAIGAIPATTGAIRLSNNTSIYGRNAANTADVQIMQFASDNNTWWNASLIPNVTGTYALGISNRVWNTAWINSVTVLTGLNLFTDTATLKFGAASDVVLQRDGAANTLALKNPVAADCFFNVYGSTGNFFQIRQAGNVTVFGTMTSYDFRINNVSTVSVKSTAIVPAVDNTTVDLGQFNFRWHNLYLGTSLIMGTNPASTGTICLPNNSIIAFRNQANTADQQAIIFNSSDQMIVNAGSDQVLWTRHIVPQGDALYAMGQAAKRFTNLYLSNPPVVNAGTGTQTGQTVLTLYKNFTSASNVGATATDLMTYTMPANTLSADGQSLRIRAWGTGAANANVKTNVLLYGASQITGRVGQPDSTGTFWRMEAVIIRTGAAAVIADASYFYGTGNGGFSGAQMAPCAQNPNATALNTAITIKVQATGAASADVTCLGMTVEWLP